MKKYVPCVSAMLLAAFGLLTLFLSSSVIFDLFGVRAKQGHYVLHVVWANFLSSVLYLLASYGFLKNRDWTSVLLGVSVSVLLVAFIGLIIHANSGGLYETKTVVALIFRMAITVVFAILAYFFILNRQKNESK